MECENQNFPLTRLEPKNPYRIRGFEYRQGKNLFFTFDSNL